MTHSTPQPLDPSLFAPPPAREACFAVKQRWRECVNLPDDHPRKQVEFLHRQMNEEINSLEISARNLADFPEAEWDLCMSMARQCADEARHVLMFQQLFEARGGRLGEYPILNFQYNIIVNIDNLIGRLAVQNRSFEAEGIDAVQFGIEAARQRGDLEMVELFEAQLADEVVHVRFANTWIREAIQRDPRNALRMAAALTTAAKAFLQVMGTEGTQGIKYDINPTGRLEAGFSPDEIQASAIHAAARHAAPQEV